MESLLQYLPILALVILILILLLWYLRNSSQASSSHNIPLVSNVQRTQAYERLLLLLERSKFQSLFQRLPIAEQPISQYQQALVAELRQELNHNMAQQLYVTDGQWQQVYQAIELSIATINTRAAEQPRTAPASVLVQSIISYELEQQNQHINTVIDKLKAEFRQLR
jgi:4-amino-4-deoxy-L-arabinose transferase-like glycosyltransferase